MKQALGEKDDFLDVGVKVWVPGRPRTKGSLKPVHIRGGGGTCRVSLTESGEYAVAWKNTMIKAIREQCECVRYAEPVRVKTFFVFEKLCGPDQDLPWPTREGGPYGHGDLDKLVRNVWDALTQSGLILDDSLIVEGSMSKLWSVGIDGAPPTPGVIITVEPA